MGGLLIENLGNVICHVYARCNIVMVWICMDDLFLGLILIATNILGCNILLKSMIIECCYLYYTCIVFEMNEVQKRMENLEPVLQIRTFSTQIGISPASSAFST